MTALIPLIQLLDDVRACTHCTDLPLGPNPVLRAAESAKILIVGQAPGTRVHNSGIPWNDPSGDNLRRWMGLNREQFYDETQIAIIPMGFCYPGKGRSGDLPPRVECAPKWHSRLLAHLPNIELTLLIGQYAQNYYFSGQGLNPGLTGKGAVRITLTERVRNWRSFVQASPCYFPLVHPSPRNRLWQAKNPWFEAEVVPELRERVKDILRSG